METIVRLLIGLGFVVEGLDLILKEDGPPGGPEEELRGARAEQR